MTDIRELSINELDAVSGGMDCKTAAAVAAVYKNAGDMCGQLGNSLGAAYMYGKMSATQDGGIC
jgi:bacteriocin-like protein